MASLISFFTKAAQKTNKPRGIVPQGNTAQNPPQIQAAPPIAQRPIIQSQQQINQGAPIQQRIAPPAPVQPTVVQRPSIIDQGFHTAVGLGKGLISADKYLANNLGLTQAAKIISPFAPNPLNLLPHNSSVSPKQRLTAAKQLALGTVKFPLQAGEQLGNTINHAIGAPEQTNLKVGPVKLNNVAPSLQTQYQQTKKTNGKLPALAETAFSAATDIAPLLGVRELGDHTPLNETGSVGKDVNQNESVPNKPKIQPQQAVGKGITPQDEQMFKSLGGNPKDLPNLTQINNAQKAELDSKTQMALHNFEQNNKPLAPPEINTAKNSFKAQIPQVEPGNFKQVISNEQAASNPTQIAGDRWQASMRKLQKTSPAEYQNFWKAVEKPNDSSHSPQLKQAIQTWRNVDDRIHGTSQALGGNTNYLQNHNLHPWNLPEDFADHIVNGGNPDKFAGLNNISRKYQTIAEGEQAGLKLGDDPLNEGKNYIGASSALLRRRAIIKGVQEADSGAESKTHILDLGGGKGEPVSKDAMKQLKGLQKAYYSDNKAIKGARTANTGLKSTLLSFGQFHPINISVLRAGPTLALPKPELLAKGDLQMGSHPIRTIKGVAGTFGAQLPKVGKPLVESMYNKALKDGVVDKAAKIGMPYAQSGFDEGRSIANKVSRGSHNLIFNRAMPMMHDQAVRSVVHDLEKSGVDLDSPEARAAGKAGNRLMGFLNKETENVSPAVRKAMGDWLLAGQFTPTKILQTGSALDPRNLGTVGGAYARANTVANVGAALAITAGIGYALHQKSDDIKDLLLRSLVDPAIPTPMKDSKGNNVKLRIPGTNTSDIAKILGITLVRNKNGHLGVSWKPGNMPSTLEDYLRARLSPLASGVTKVATHSTFANYPLFDPNAPAGQKAEQAATGLASGVLPIGLQGLPMTSGVEKHLPGSVQEVLNAQKPGTNPLLKSVESSFGFTPSSDNTVGKDQQSTQYYNAVDQASKGLNSQAKDAYNMWTGSKKNPVTGKYDVMPNANDSRAKASALLDNPQALNALIKLNTSLAKQGQKVDPLWQQSKGNIVSYLEYQNMAPGGSDRTDWINKNPWYAGNPNDPKATGLLQARNAFFNSLPPGDPNKPKLGIQYPDVTPQLQKTMDQYSNITDSTQKSNFLNQHPELITQFNKQADYTNQMRQALGYSPLKNYPEATSQLQSFMDKYNAASKSARTSLRNSNPQQYQGMIGYFDSVDLYNVGKQASVSQLQGEPDTTSKELKDISSLSQDIYQNPQGTYNIVPAGWMQGLSNSSSGSSGSSSSGNQYSGYSTSKYSTVPKVKSITTGFKTAKNAGPAYKAKSVGKLPKLPTGVKVKTGTFKATKPKKLSVGKIPKSKVKYA